MSYIWLNRKVEYALIILKILYSANNVRKVLSSAKIVEDTRLPSELVSKILQRLCKFGILVSSKGARGGYLLEKDLQTIDFHYLNECILGKRYVVPCLDRKENCEKMPNCEIEKSMCTLDQKVKNFWSNFTVEDVISNRYE